MSDKLVNRSDFSSISPLQRPRSITNFHHNENWRTLINAVLRLSRVLSGQITAKGGHRTLDIFHVATAVHLGARRFLTFDARQQALARHAGLDLLRHANFDPQQEGREIVQ